MSNLAQSGIKNPSAATQTALAREREVDEIINRWDNGEKADAAAALRAAPHLAASRSAVVILAYEEYCQRKESGETIVVDQFVANFAQHETAVRRVIWFHQLDRNNPRLPKRLELGKDVGNYEVVDWLGRGAFSHVYLACDLSLAQRPVVLKVTSMPGLEAEALATVDSPYVVPVYAATSEADGPTTIVMPFFGTATFEDLLTRLRQTPRARGQLIFDVAAMPADLAGRNPPATMPTEFARRPFVEGAVWLLRGIAEGLSKAHESGYLHLDLKPSNILLAAGGCPMLADFNLSQRVDEIAKAVGGTVPYMAPEQLRRFVGNKQIEVTAAADVYAFGVIAHELLTGEHPDGPIDPQIEPQKLAALLLEQSRPRRRPASSRRLNPSLRRLIDRCLHPDPKRRPTSEELRKCLTRELKPASRIVRLGLRKPLVTGLAGLVLAAAMAGGLVAWSLRPPEHVRLTADATDAFHKGEHLVATALVSRALEVDPQYTEALKLKAEIAIDQTLWNEAIEVLVPLIAATGDAKLKELCGYAYVQQKNWEKALDVYRPIFQSGDRTVANLNNYVRAAIMAGEHREAEYIFSDPTFPRIVPAEILYHRALLAASRAPFNKINPINGLRDAIDAQKLAGDWGDLCLLIARLRAHVAEYEEQDPALIIADLYRARMNGITQVALLTESVFVKYRSEADAAELARIEGNTSRKDMPKVIRP